MTFSLFSLCIGLSSLTLWRDEMRWADQTHILGIVIIIPRYRIVYQ